jgi:hydroxymethylbilane synthase
VNRIIIGTRGSPLALIQAEAVRAEIARHFPRVKAEIRKIKTRGDAFLDRAPPEIGGKGFFTEEIERALLRDEIDMAVHSLKDLPTELGGGLEIGSYGRRGEARDALVSLKYASLDGLPAGAKIGTSSLRRRSQLLALRPDLDVVDLRGNVGTRLKKLDTGGLDAIVVAAAGMIRLGMKERITEIVSVEKMLPAPGQGMIAVEVKAGRSDIAPILSGINDRESAVMAAAERGFLRAINGGCRVPVGALASMRGGTVSLAAYVGSPDGKACARDHASGKAEDACEIGKELARRMMRGRTSFPLWGEVR